MGKLRQHIRAELRLVPLMLGKLLGGIMAVSGFSLAVFLGTHGAETTAHNLLLPIFMGIAGLALFLLANRRMSLLPGLPTQKAIPEDRTSMNIMAWALLMLFALMFLAFVYFQTR